MRSSSRCPDNLLRRIVTGILMLVVAPIPTKVGVFLRRLFYSLWFKRVGDTLCMEDGVTVAGFQNIELGDRVLIMRNSALYAFEGELSIGDDVAINSNVQLGADQGRIVIGNGCLIGPNCVLRSADHCFENPDVPIREQGHKGGIITLEEDVWLASNVVVTRDVRIGKGSVIGAQSLVTKDIPPYSIAYGIPAKVIRSRR